VSAKDRSMTILDVANYSAVETLNNGRLLEVRAFKPDDREDFMSAVARTSVLSLYRRFFAVKQEFSEREKSFFLNVDFDKHVALIALIEEAGRKAIVGGGRYVMVKSETAELAFVMIDQYQGQGIGTMLLRHLVVIARARGVQTLVAEVLSENLPMLKVFTKSGLPMATRLGSEVVHVTFQLK
jgi:RimJ/RimL family protein N-acetyltransferase